MNAGVGYSNYPDSSIAGRRAAEQAVQQSNRKSPCDLALLFCTAKHNQKALRAAVAGVVGNNIPIYGGGAAGIITNDKYGYDGDQVGVACLWLDGDPCNVVVDGGLLSNGEQSTGQKLGEGLKAIGTAPDSSVMLLYDAVHRHEAGVRLMMATWLLEGLNKGLGFLPELLVGAGMMGDHACNVSGQFTGTGGGRHQAMALAFGGGLRIDNTIMHGCYPASPYYTVTKAEDSVILEINGKPALQFLDELLGSSVKPEDYPFFLLFGINGGGRWEPYDEDKYASRLCLAIAPERGGIVMFEPDMVEGTEFQLMYRSLEVDYIKPRVDALFEQLDNEGRNPVFAMYINCAGRCAGYGGTDMEDAVALQEAVNGRVPLFGMYTGVEIAAVAGVPRGLDWTGVFCLFSEPKNGGKSKLQIKNYKVQAPDKNMPSAPDSPLPIPNAPMPVDFAAKMCERNAAKVLALDAQFMKFRHELELKRRGFRIISELAVSIRQSDNYENVFARVAKKINASLNMQKTIVLFANKAGAFVPAVLQGFSETEWTRLSKKSFYIPEELLSQDPVLVTGADAPERFKALRREFGLPYFISSPIFLHGDVSALLISGRMFEQGPFLARLNPSDAETIQALAELIGSVIVRMRLQDVTIKAETDNLTGLWNRDTFQRLVQMQLNDARKQVGAFLMIDIDHFKSINDMYLHTGGDEVLIACGEAMRKVLRDTDIIGRMGGDEFAVFCRGIGDSNNAERKAEQIQRAWKQIVPKGGAKPISTSIGIALTPQHGIEFNQLYNCADMALYKAKQSGRDQYMLYKGD